MLLGSRASDPVGFHGTHATVQRSGAAQAAVTATSGAAVTGSVGAAVATTGASNSSPYGFTGATQADRLVALVNELRVDSLAQTTLINTLRTDLIAALALVNELRAAVVAKGLIKGAA